MVHNYKRKVLIFSPFSGSLSNRTGPLVILPQLSVHQITPTVLPNPAHFNSKDCSEDDYEPKDKILSSDSGNCTN